MKMHVFDEVPTLHKYIQDRIYGELVSAPSGLHVLPTGKTFVTAYDLLRNKLLQSTTPGLDFSTLKLLNLDEYLQAWKVIPPADKRSFRSYMNPLVQVLCTLGFDPSNHIFPDTPYGFNYVFTRYELLIKFDELVLSLGQATSAFLGLGPPESPHIAFVAPGYVNEIGHPWEEIGAYVSPIDAPTQKANQGDTPDSLSGNVPEYATTISPATLVELHPQNVYLVAYGNKNLRPLLIREYSEHTDLNLFPAEVLFILEAQGSTVHLITDRATWDSSTL